MMTKRMNRSMMAMVMLALLVTGAFLSVAAMPSASADNPYVGAWACDYGDVRMDIFADGTLQIIYPDDPGTGYYYEYIFDDDGGLLVLAEGNEYIMGLVMWDYNTLGDSQDSYWTRIG